MLERGGARPMHCGASGRFDRFQIETALLAEPGEGDLEQPIYFESDFPMDRFRRFFSCADKASSTGRKRQIFSLTATKSRLIC
jgi:hypothetical protein